MRAAESALYGAAFVLVVTGGFIVIYEIRRTDTALRGVVDWASGLPVGEETSLQAAVRNISEPGIHAQWAIGDLATLMRARRFERIGAGIAIVGGAPNWWPTSSRSGSRAEIHVPMTDYDHGADGPGDVP